MPPKSLRTCSVFDMGGSNEFQARRRSGFPPRAWLGKRPGASEVGVSPTNGEFEKISSMTAISAPAPIVVDVVIGRIVLTVAGIHRSAAVVVGGVVQAPARIRASPIVVDVVGGGV